MLTMDIDEQFAQFAECLKRLNAAIDISARAAVGGNQSAQVAFIINKFILLKGGILVLINCFSRRNIIYCQIVFTKPVTRLWRCANIKNRADFRPFRSRANDTALRPVA